MRNLTNSASALIPTASRFPLPRRMVLKLIVVALLLPPTLVWSQPGPPAAAPMPTPAPVLAPPPMGRQVAPYVAQRRARQLKAPSFALDVARIVSGVFSASYSFPINGHLEAGPILAAGSPSRARLERYNTAEVGGFASWFPIGNRVKGAGFTGRARYLYGWGEGESDSGGTIDASAHAVSASALVTARYTALTGLRLEVQGGLMWLSSRAQATEGETTKRSKLDVPLSTVSLLVGWTF